MFTTPKKIARVCVINDLVTDHRVYKTCICLHELGYEVELIGRLLPGSLPIPGSWPFKTLRMRLLFKKGPLFYLFFQFRLFIALVLKKVDLLVANDLDTLLPAFVISKFKGCRLVYDSHEVFCEVPELQNSPAKKKIWEKLEAFLLPKLSTCITVNESIKQYFETKYGVPFHVVRNIPAPLTVDGTKNRNELGLPENQRIIILQGAGLNINRGVEELIKSMAFTQNITLLIIGSGDVWPVLPQLIKETRTENKIRLIQKIPKQTLWHYTRLADLGISIDKDTNLNYKWSLPNKVFDYIHAGIPILASRLTEIERLITHYNIGAFIDSHHPEHIAKRIEECLSNPDYQLWKSNLKKAETELTWEKEKNVLISCLKG
ncbi:MAG: glycosyltransferase [Sediminibacterium sp.]|nr:glycosyltransferase [Sediminibacterium sp.]